MTNKQGLAVYNVTFNNGKGSTYFITWGGENIQYVPVLGEGEFSEK